MAYTFEINPRTRRVDVRVKGRDTAADLTRRVQEITGDPLWSPGFDILVDTCEVNEFDFSTSDIQDIARLHEDMNKLIGGGKLAIAAPRDLIYGVGRMWETLAEGRTALSIRVFRSLEEAETWLTADRV